LLRWKANQSHILLTKQSNSSKQNTRAITLHLNRREGLEFHLQIEIQLT
jgi:hypothetical protein